jgi:phenylacetic acid degradation protein paaN
MSHEFFDDHRETLDRALEAIRTREYWSAYPEVPSGKIYGETAKADAEAFFKSLRGNHFEIEQPSTGGKVGQEVSPYGFELGITYPAPDLNLLMPAMQEAMQAWRHADVETRVGVCLEALKRLNAKSFEMAFAVMHTTGQGFMMAFQAGGPHAQDRGLEAVAYAYQEMTRTPTSSTWKKRVGKDETVTLEKRYRIVPRGIAATIGCSTFPTWNGYPGIFASLATGNAVIIKPHPGAILPLALTVRILRETLKDAGFDPNVVTLAADTIKAPISKDLVMRDEVKIVDYTGSSAFGDWIEQHAHHAAVFTEKAGVNSIVIDSLDNLKAVTGNIAFSLSLYSGQMCTASQNIFIPKDGVKVGGEQTSFDEVAGSIVKAVDWLLGDDARAAEVLGAVQNQNTIERIKNAKAEAKTVLRESKPVNNAQFPEARTASPLIVRVDAKDEPLYMREMFGPIVYIVATESTAHSLELARRGAQEHGGITMSVYSTDEKVIDDAVEAAAEAHVPLSCNLTGSIWVNQAAAFSDFHVSGGNPAGNATLCDAHFVAGRFHVVQSRIPVPETAAV